MTRLHARQLALVARAHGDGWRLGSPMPGRFRPTARTGASLEPGAQVGVLEVLGTTHELVVPAGAAGFVANQPAPGTVQYGDVLVELAAGALATAAGAAAPATATAAATGLVFRAPTSGRFYGRAAPDKPPFVRAGDELAAGATVCLLEVMKTFHRVHYGGAELPERARVREVLAGDGDDVNAGDPLLALDPL